MTNSDASGFSKFIQTIPGSTVSFEMMAIPAGEITCGSPPKQPGRDRHDRPLRTVNVRPFWLGKHEVTWQEYLLYAHLASSEIASFRPDTRVPIDQDGITHPSRFYGAADRGRGDGFPHSPWWLTADFVGFRVAMDAEITPLKPRPIPTKKTGQ